MLKRLIGLALLTTAMGTGCSKVDDAPGRDTLTRAQRDSAIARSGLPGAKGVEGALGAADSARARAARVDSVTPP